MYKIGFFVLLLVNIVLSVILTLRPIPKPRVPQMGIKEQISKELGFSEEQKAIFDEMAKNHRETIRSIDEQERASVRLFFNQLALENVNENTEMLLEEIVQFERDKLLITYRHFEELKGICDEEQIAKFDKVVERIVPVLTNTPDRQIRPENPPH